MIIQTGLEPKISGPTEVSIVQSKIKFGDAYTPISSPNPGGSLYVIEFGDMTLFSKHRPGVQNLSVSNVFDREVILGQAGPRILNDWMKSTGAPLDALVRIDVNLAVDMEMHTMTWWEVSI